MTNGQCVICHDEDKEIEKAEKVYRQVVMEMERRRLDRRLNGA